MLRSTVLALAIVALVAGPATAQVRAPSSHAAPAARTSGIPAGTYTSTVARTDLPDSLPATEADSVVGAWTLTFDSAGHVTVRRRGTWFLEGDMKPIAAGRVEFDANDTGPHACHAAATYRYTVRGNRLTFTKVADPCAGRAFSLTLHPWTRGT